MPYGYHQYPQANRQLPFLATLYLPDQSCLTNDPIQHAPFWPAIPAKLPSDILKFDEKPGEDPNNHVMNFHLWCSSNSLMDDSICLRLFQRTLTGATTKWYIELLFHVTPLSTLILLPWISLCIFSFLYGMIPKEKFEK
jgi:hypothetical protein